MSVVGTAVLPKALPTDADIEILYNDVWTSYSEDPQLERELDSIYHIYGEDAQSSKLQHQNSTADAKSHPVNLPTSPESSKFSVSIRSPTSKEPRPLPRPPGATSGSAAEQLPPHENRNLPPAPSISTNGFKNSHYPGLPSDVRPTHRHQHTDSSSINYNSPTTSTSSAEWNAAYKGGTDSESTVTPGGYPPVRPYGAGAPSIPGVYDPRSDMSTAHYPPGELHAPARVSSLAHYHKELADNQIYQSVDSTSKNYADIPPPPPHPITVNSFNGISPSMNKEQSSDLTPSPSQYVPPPDVGHPYSQNLGRSTSAGSNVLGQTGMLDRNLSSKSSVGTGYFAGYGSSVERSSTAATTIARGNSKTSFTGSEIVGYPRQSELYTYPKRESSHSNVAGPSHIPGVSLEYTAVPRGRGPLELHDDDEDEYWEDEDDDDNRFVNFSLLSHIAVQLRDKVPRGTHVKGSIPYPRAFTGKDIVSTIQSQIQRELLINHGVSTTDRRAATQVARSLQSQLFFYEVEWGARVLQDGVEDVYMFLDDQEGGSEAHPEREELPTGVVTMLTKCYSPSCGELNDCYSYSCPRRGQSAVTPVAGQPEATSEIKPDWPETVEQEVLMSLPESEINRQTIIHKVISKEEQYVQDLDTVESSFIKPLRQAHPPVIRRDQLDDFIEDVFGNILDLRECNRRLLEVMFVRQREQAPVIQRIGDVFLDAATEFRLAYPIYVGHLPLAEKRMKDEVENNPEFRLFLEQCSRQSARNQESIRLDLKHFLNRPSEHLQKYPVLLDAIFHETAVGNPDADYLKEAIEAIKNLQTVAQLRTFQSAMGKGVTGKWEWHDLVSIEIRQSLPKREAKRQSIIFELIKGEMAYVKDLENIEIMYIRALRAADPPVIPPDRLNQFIQDVFHNFAELHAHHRKLVDQFHEIQREEHPMIRTVTAAVFDAVLNFRESYMEYIPNYPIAAYRIDDEMANSPAFKAFVEQCVRHPDAHRLDMKSFINRPIPRLLRYELLLKGILEETPPGHEDQNSIPEVLELIKALGKETEPGVVSSKQKVELWRYNSNLVFKPGEAVDMDLLDENRSLIFTGKLLRQPETEWKEWGELFVLLFDNYLVMTKPKERDGVTKYRVDRRPIPLDLLTLANFTDPPTQRGAGFIRGLRGGGDQSAMTPTGMAPESTSDSRSVYPCTVHHNGRLGGLYTLYAESAQIRAEWKQKLEEAIGLRKVVQESNKVFEMETLSAETFLVPSLVTGATTPSWNNENSYTGKVTCSVPFNTPDGRGLVAIGCAEGVWIGYRHDSRSMRRVLHLKMVTQCAMLEDFSIFLVLADKALFAYHLEALVPSGTHNSNVSQAPQKLNGSKDVHFFSVGNLHGRTLVIYMKKKGVDSVFRVLEPVVERINDRSRAPAGFGSRLGIRTPRSEWFRVYRDFFLPCESFDLIFLKAKIAILCTKGFEIMDLTDFQSVTIPQRDDPKLEKLSRRCESCRPIGMFRSKEDEFLLCYDEFGLYVDNHGDLSRSTGTIEWEGTAERVALHHPYILLFDGRFIEIRHVKTGRLAQIIPGNDIRCLWDGRGLSAPITTPSLAEDHVIQEARVHGVMNDPESAAQHGSGRSARAVAQMVFELIPTIPLYLPGSLASPSTATYFPSQSPPRSPQLHIQTQLRPSTSWRD